MDDNIVKKIIAKYGTPLYVFDIESIKKRIEYLRKIMPEKVAICYAIKANPFIVKDIEKYVDGFEVCSPGEYEICYNKDIEDSKILISGIYKNEELIERVNNTKKVKCFTIESMNQFEILKNTKNNIQLMLRLTSGNQFGINKEDIEKIIKEISNYPQISICGIQYFSGTQKTSLKILEKEITRLVEFIKELKEKYNFITKELEYGPGFPYMYFENTEFDEEEFLKGFAHILENMDFGGKIILELGRSIVANSGIYLTKVVDIKQNKDQNYAIVDGGINHITYYGQSMAMKTPKMYILGKENTAKSDEKINICGSLCTINDILVKQYEAQKLELGDILVFQNAGAYCVTEGISLFLSRNLPKVIKIDENGNIRLLRDDMPTYKFNS